MNKIGIIGGIGPASTIEYYRMLIKAFRTKLDTDHYPEFILHSINMTEMLDHVYNNRLEDLVELLKAKIKVFEQSGIDYVAMASNTPHLVFKILAASVNVKMISIVEETCKAIAKTGIKKAGLLGTKSTMSRGFYQSEGKDHGIEIFTPIEEQQNYVHEKYMGELVFNQIKPETKNRLIQIINEMEQKDQIEGIILGGTELPLILDQKDFDHLKVFNTTAIHVDAILDKMIGEPP